MAGGASLAETWQIRYGVDRAGEQEELSISEVVDVVVVEACIVANSQHRIASSNGPEKLFSLMASFFHGLMMGNERRLGRLGD